MSLDPRILLTVSGSIPSGLDDEVGAGLRPRTDYRVLAARIGAELVDADQALRASGRLGGFLQRIAGVGPLLGWYAFRRRRDYDVIVTDGEHVGIPLALMMRMLGRRDVRHVMVAHILSVPKKAALIRWTRIACQIDRYIVYCRFQADFLRDDLGIPTDRVVTSAFMVDTAFFDPDRVTAKRRRMICSAGLERRDYPTLIDAVDGLDVEVIITASSAWSKRDDSSGGRELPANVTVTRLSMTDFRQMYADAAFVVMPLEAVEFQAGITTILEAMAMGRAVICTRVAGQTDSVIDGETAVCVTPGDAAALRATIERLLGSPSEAERLGRNGRAWAMANADIERYANEIDAVVTDVLSSR